MPFITRNSWILGVFERSASTGLLMLLLGLLVPFLIAACGGDDPTAVPRQGEGSASQTTSRSTTSLGPTTSPNPTTAPAATANDVDSVRMSAQGFLGGRLTDSNGMTLYSYLKDERDVSQCFDGCAETWPPFLPSGDLFASRGINSDWLTTIHRDDGGVQAAYNGMPLYRFAGDARPGDANGQGQDEVWFVVSAKGHALYNSATVNAADRWVASKVGGGDDTQYGEFSAILVDITGRSLYLFTDDELEVSKCAGDCALAWPPLITIEDPTAGEGVLATRIGTSAREDGSIQVTFDGSPLYYYAGDRKRGDSLGQDVNNTWYVINNSDPLTVPLEEQNDSGQTGTAVLTGRANLTNISLALSAGALETELAHIHEGSCGPGNLGGVVYDLTSFEAGSGISITNIQAPLADLISGEFAVNTHESGEPSVYTSCGNINGDGG